MNFYIILPRFQVRLVKASCRSNTGSHLKKFLLFINISEIRLQKNTLLL